MEIEGGFYLNKVQNYAFFSKYNKVIMKKLYLCSQIESKRPQI